MPTVGKKTKTSRVFMLAGVFVVFVCACMALVSYKVGYWPWELRWFDENGIASPIWMIVLENINEFVALGVSSLLLMLFGLIGLRPKPETLPEPDAAIETGAASEEIAAVTIVSVAPEAEAADKYHGEERDSSGTEAVVEPPKEPGKATVDRNKDAQLQIALAEITRLKKDLVVSRREREAAEKVKSQFLSNMSHELRTPMNGIMGMTDLILEGELSKKQRHFAQSINSSSESLLNVINDLLDFSRIESGDMQLDNARFDFGACAEDVCGMLAASAHSKGVELICYVDEDMPRFVTGDATRLRQVLNNLVSNSIAFTNEGEIVVRLSCLESTDSHHVFQCDVQDTGAGIAPELQATMFESFNQADQSNTRQHGGLGIGLAITNELVALMGGKVSFRSRLGEGTRFTFTAKFERVSDENTGGSVHADIGDADILIVDDNETNRSILFHQVSAWGYTAELAESGSQALDILNASAEDSHKFDAVILDLHMPGMDGLELAREIRKTPSIADTKAMMLTSAIVDITPQEMRELGIGTYISKPARQSQLRECLRDLIYSDGSASISGQRSVSDLFDASKHSPINVLVVEDDAVNLDVVSSMLAGMNCHVTPAYDGQQAVSLANEKRFDVIFMDCQLPVLDGFSAAGRIKDGSGLNSDTPIVALTAKAMPGDRERCIEAGMQDYLSKPVRQSQVMDVLNKWLGSESSEGNTAEIDINKPDIVLSDVDENKVVELKPAAKFAEESAELTVPSDSDVIVDMAAIEKIRELQRPGKPDLLSKVLNLYFTKMPEQLEQIKVGAEQEDFDEVKSVVHAMKSSSAYLGAQQLVTACVEIETSISEGETSKVAPLLNLMLEQYEQVKETLEPHYKAA